MSCEIWRIAHPMRHIPNEISGEIFLHCRDDDANSFSNCRNSLDPSTFPWPLARVSRRWRNVAIFLPSLWSVVHIHIPGDFDFGSVTAAQWALFLGTQLVRASSKPLKMLVVGFSEISRGHSLIGSLLPTSHQWQDSTLLLPFSTFKHVAQDLKGH
ncbi:hypothetical protein C8J56DRAFT_965055 [Mycena floridula]|nr:hypothetical protein C8J56DRAFT_965055 [Mycena floridula]